MSRRQAQRKQASDERADIIMHWLAIVLIADVVASYHGTPGTRPPARFLAGTYVAVIPALLCAGRLCFTVFPCALSLSNACPMIQPEGTGRMHVVLWRQPMRDHIISALVVDNIC